MVALAFAKGRMEKYTAFGKLITRKVGWAAVASGAAECVLIIWVVPCVLALCCFLNEWHAEPELAHMGCACNAAAGACRRWGSGGQCAS